MGKAWQSRSGTKPLALFSGEPRNAFWTRHIAIQKAKVARRNAVGQGAPTDSRLYDRARRTGHGALITCREVTLSFLQFMFFFLSACFTDTRKQWAMVAKTIIWVQQQAAGWRIQPWYAILLRQLQAWCSARSPRNGGISLSSEAQKPHEVVGTALQQGSADFNKA